MCVCIVIIVLRKEKFSYLREKFCIFPEVDCDNLGCIILTPRGTPTNICLFRSAMFLL